MKSILAPTDFSASSINAVNYAADLALKLNAQLVLFSAISYPTMIPETSLPASAIDSMLELAREDMSALAGGLRERTEDKLDIFSEVALGSVNDQIETFSELKKPVAIVMAVKPGKTIEHVFLGSTVLHTMNHIPYPLLVIPEHVYYSEIHEIGLACDLEKMDAGFPIREIRQWLSLFKARVNILHVTIDNKIFKPEQVVGSVTLQNQLESFHPEFHSLKGHNLADAINEYAKTHTLDLLIVIPRTHGISQIFGEKHSRKLISQIPLPVLAIHDQSNL